MLEILLEVFKSEPKPVRTLNPRRLKIIIGNMEYIESL